MSTIKVDTIATRTGSGNITLSNNVASLTSAGAISGTNLTASGTLGVTGAATFSGGIANTGTITAGTVGSNVVFPSGHIIQTVQVATDHQQSINTTSYTTLANYSPVITPKYSNSKILVNVCLHFGEGSDAFPAFKVYRTPSGGSATQIAQGANLQQRASFAYVGTENSGRDQYRITLLNWQYLDSPSTTDALTYHVDVSPMRTTPRLVVFNRHNEMSDSNRASTISTFTLQEIAQ